MYVCIRFIALNSVSKKKKNSHLDKRGTGNGVGGDGSEHYPRRRLVGTDLLCPFLCTYLSTTYLRIMPVWTTPEAHSTGISAFDKGYLSRG